MIVICCEWISDLVFLQGTNSVLKVGLVLLGNHKELIKQCDSFESVVEFLKTTLPEMGIIQMERIINQVSCSSLDNIQVRQSCKTIGSQIIKKKGKKYEEDEVIVKRREMAKMFTSCSQSNTAMAFVLDHITMSSPEGRQKLYTPPPV